MGPRRVNVFRLSDGWRGLDMDEAKRRVKLARLPTPPRASSMPPKPVRQVKVPVERPAVKYVSVSQSWFAEPPTKEPPPRVDLREAGEKSASRNIAHDLKDLAFQLSRFQSADKLVERLSADEREEVRLGIEAVMRIKAALDRPGQRNAQLHKERQRAP